MECPRIGKSTSARRERDTLARLGSKPACVPADEPTGNLDRHTAAQLFEMMLALNRSHGTSFVIVTHDPGIAARAPSASCGRRMGCWVRIERVKKLRKAIVLSRSVPVPVRESPKPSRCHSFSTQNGDSASLDRSGCHASIVAKVRGGSVYITSNSAHVLCFELCQYGEKRLWDIFELERSSGSVVPQRKRGVDES